MRSARAALFASALLVLGLSTTAANAEPCTAPSECASGFCVSGVCCDTACNTPCQACSAATKVSGPDGTCGTAAAGTTCGTATCTGGQVTNKRCDAAGTCLGQSFGCAPYACGPEICKSTCNADTDCAMTAYCLAQECVPKKAVAAPCAGANECASTFCADGVCCDAACEGQCNACDETGFVGKCRTVTGQPRPNRFPCAGATTICAGICNGESTSCTYPTAVQSCGEMCTGGKETLSSCDGAGSCKAVDRQCTPFACGTDGNCRTECTDDAHCGTGFRCTGDKCIPAGAKCSEDLTSSTAADDTLETCAPFTCEKASGACRKICTTSSDCAAGFACDSATKVCTRLESSADEGGCAYGHAPGSFVGLAVAMAMLGMTRRSRRHA